MESPVKCGHPTLHRILYPLPMVFQKVNLIQFINGEVSILNRFIAKAQLSPNDLCRVLQLEGHVQGRKVVQPTQEKCKIGSAKRISLGQFEDGSCVSGWDCVAYSSYAGLIYRHKDKVLR